MNLKSVQTLTFVALGLAAVIGGGCATESNTTPAPVVTRQKAGSTELRGTLSYPSNVSLPAGTTVNVALVRSTYIEEAVDVLNSIIISQPGSSPIKFAIPYDSAQIKPGERYSVAARVFSNGKLILRSNAYLVFNFGGPNNDLAVDLIPVN